LLNARANPNITDKYGRTALMQASRYGHEDIVKMLLAAEADPNLAEVTGDTALIVASREGHRDIVELLLNAGANPNRANRDGDTALMRASWKGHTAIVELLLNARANPNLADADGETALMLAARRDTLYPQELVDIVRMLLNAGANPNLVDRYGRTALMRTYKGHEVIVKMLKDAEKFQNEKSSSKKSSGSLDLKTLKVKELRSIAKKYKIKGRSKATTKDKLITLLRDNLSSEDLSREINSFRPDRSFAPRRPKSKKSSGNQYILSPSTRSGKKWSIQTPTGKTVHFGSAGMSDYTIHKDPERKERYIKRHAGNSSGKTSRREDWTKVGLDTPGFWSRWLLWGEPSLQGSINKIEKDFGIDIVKRSQSPRNPRRRNRY